MIEEFIEGKEISICMIGYKGNIKRIAAVEYIKQGFEVKSYESKKLKIGSEKFIDAPELLTTDIVNRVTHLFQSLDKVEFMRLDFLYRNGVFYNLELTPDPALSCISCMYFPFRREMTFTEFIGFLILNCRERYRVTENLSS